MEEEKRILSILEEMNTRFDRTDERLEKLSPVSPRQKVISEI